MSDPIRLLAGIDIGVTNIKSMVVTVSGQVVSRQMDDTHPEDPNWPRTVRQRLATLEQAHGALDAVGIAAPGIAAAEGNCIMWMQGRLSEVQDLNWSTFLERPVPVLNDAQAALVAEVWQGAGRGAKNAILLTLGTGVGGALMVDGNLLHGHLGRAGHLGHISLNPDGAPDIVNTPGSLEEAIGNCTINQRTGGRFSSTHDLLRQHEKGDSMATEVWMRSVHQLAAGIASLINVADPEVVIIGGGISRAGDLLFMPLRRALDRFEWRPHGSKVRIVPAELGEYAGAMGAARNAMRLAN